MVSKRDVIVSRGIWYVMTLLSLLGLSISINILWPGKYVSSKSCAVGATTFYAVMLIRYLFFTDPPSRCYKEFKTWRGKFYQIMLSYLALSAVIVSPFTYKFFMKEFVLSVLLFTISLFTGGIGLIQLSHKLRMETRYAFRTLFLGWVLCLSGMYIGSSYEGQELRLGVICQSTLVCFLYIYLVSCRSSSCAKLLSNTFYLVL